MRYESITLHNYVGIYYGMNLNDITIDFNKCQSNKILVIGPNGSGKSTLVHSINPYPESNEYFISGKEASKTIILLNGDIKYCIRYIHPVDKNGERSTTKGYISKIEKNCPPIELNPSGNISSCKDIIYNEFDFEAGFISLAQLSSEDRGLVERKPAERKKIVSYIITSLDTYNNIYKTINKKYGIIKGMITNITNKIDMIGDRTKLMATLDNISKQIDSYEETKYDLIKRSAIIKLKIEELDQYLKSSNYNEISDKINELNVIIKNNSVLLDNICKKYNIESIDKLKSFYIYITNQIDDTNNKVNDLIYKLESSMKDRELEFSRLQDKQERLNDLKSEFNENITRKTLNQFKNKADEFKSVFDKMGLLNINLITKDEFNTAMQSLHRLKESSETLMFNYNMSDIIFIIENRSQAIININSISSIENDINYKKKQLTDLAREISIYTSKREIAKELVNRPKNCKIDSCIYISAALEANNKYPQDGLIKLQKDYDSLENIIKELELEINHNRILMSVLKDIDFIIKELNISWPFISKLPINPNFKDTFLQRIINYDKFNDIENLYEFVDCGNMLQEYKLLLDNIDKYESQVTLYESKASLIDSIVLDINKFNKAISDIDNNINSINEEIKSNKTKVLELTNVKAEIEKIININDTILTPSIQEQKDFIEKKEKLDSSVDLLKNSKFELNELDHKLNSVNTNIKSLNSDKENINHSLSMLDQYNADLEEYHNQYKLVERIRYYSSPSTGIQNIYLSMFMNKILSTANQLLSLLFNGRFMFGSFIINENEFRIPAIGESGIMHSDISEMSSAEKSMLSLVISFSLLYASSTKYNIISLDESDGPLDSDNRTAFVNLLDQIMNILHVEQAFIISHNPEIDTTMCDIINLNKTNLTNNNIIWQL